MMASANIKIGPTIQFKTSEMDRILVFLNTLGNKEYFTLANGGYIIKINPMAMGILVVPLLNELTKSGKVGKKYPMTTPTIIATKIQRVKFLSKKLNFLVAIIFLFEKKCKTFQ